MKHVLQTFDLQSLATFKKSVVFAMSISNGPVQLLRLDAVLAVTGLSRSKLYELIQTDEFPSPVHLSARCVAWIASEVHAWIQACISRREHARRTRKIEVRDPGGNLAGT